MAHIHEEYLTIKISKLMKGEHKDCPCVADLSDEAKESLEAVVADLLNDPSLIVELDVAHDHGDE
jgi:hypothetical protein